MNLQAMGEQLKSNDRQVGCRGAIGVCLQVDRELFIALLDRGVRVSLEARDETLAQTTKTNAKVWDKITEIRVLLPSILIVLFVRYVPSFCFKSILGGQDTI